MKESDQKRAAKFLKSSRKQIDELDIQILKLLGARFRLVKKIAGIKSKHDIPSYLPERIAKVRGRSVKAGKKYGIDPAFMYSLYSSIIYQSCEIEDKIRKELKKKA